jgi:hypothetical protein
MPTVSTPSFIRTLLLVERTRAIAPDTSIRSSR